MAQLKARKERVSKLVQVVEHSLVDFGGGSHASIEALLARSVQAETALLKRIPQSVDVDRTNRMIEFWDHTTRFYDGRQSLRLAVLHQLNDNKEAAKPPRRCHKKMNALHTRRIMSHALVSALALLATLAGCSTLKSWFHSPSRAERLTGVKKFHYQLGDLVGFTDKHSADHDTLFVIDYSKDGTDVERFGWADVAKLKGRGNVVLAYLNIGEAEEVRWYYKNLPKKLLSPQNSALSGKHTVYYWDRAWQDIIGAEHESSLSRILAIGFDGVYLDHVDAYSRFPDRKGAAAAMIAWVERIANRARSINDDFIVVQQNAVCLPDRGNYSELSDEQHAALLSRYWPVLDGISVESPFFSGGQITNNAYSPQSDTLRCLSEYRSRQKNVFAVEFLSDPEKQAKAMQEFLNAGILGVATDRSLKGLFFAHPINHQ